MVDNTAQHRYCENETNSYATWQQMKLDTQRTLDYMGVLLCSYCYKNHVVEYPTRDKALRMIVTKLSVD